MQIEVMDRRKLAQEVGCAGHVEEGARPAAARVANAAILDVPGGNATLSKGSAGVAKVV